MSRSVPEWIGATPDSVPPPRVRQRVFDRFDGICQETGRKILPGDEWQCDHEIALINGGENRERNLRPVLTEGHKVKTARDVAQKAKDDRVRKKHLGIWEADQPLPFGRKSKLKRKINGEIVPR